MTSKRLLGEFLGTFVIVVVPVLASATGANLLLAALASGIAVLAMVYVLGPVSGAHFNPAVTVAFWSVKRFPAKEIPAYTLVQLAGGIAAAAVGAMLFKPGFGAHVPAAPIPNSIGVEFLLTAVLMFVVMGVATGPRDQSSVVGIVIGLTVTMNILFGGPITGASMNPARTLGPNIFAGGAAISNLWLYLTFPVAGAVAGAWLYELVRPANGHES